MSQKQTAGRQANCKESGKDVVVISSVSSKKEAAKQVLYIDRI